MNRIDNRLNQLKEKNEKAFITYVTAGFPTLEKSKEIIAVQEAAGVDVIELGIPFSDPVADGPVIQDASYEAIQNGVTLEKVLLMMRELRSEGCAMPIVFMMYYNTIYHYGLERFARACAECGVDGVIVPDLPYEEQADLQAALTQEENAPYLLQLISPVSKDRIPMLLENAKGFVYCISQMGVTGSGADFHKNIRDYLSSVKAVSKVPVMMGFGIRSPEDVRPLLDVIDGAIVGSNLIRLLKKTDYSLDAVKAYAADFKQKINER